MEHLSLLLFVSSVTIVFALFASVLVRIAIDALKKEKSVLSNRDKVLLTLGSVGIGCILYGWLIEPYWLEVVHVSLSSPKIKAGQTVRIAHVSDIHSDKQERLETKMAEAVAREKPDIIVFSGDAINSPEGLPNFRNCLTRLAKIAPTFVVKGNWDSWYFKDSDRFGGTGATELVDKPSMVRVKDNDVWIGGLPVGTKSSVAKVMAEVPEKRLPGLFVSLS